MMARQSAQEKLPACIMPLKLCQNAPQEGTQLSGYLFLKELARISEFQVQEETRVYAHFRFWKDAGGYSVVSGEMSVTLCLTCQRCLQPMDQEVRSAFSVSPVFSDEQAKQLPSQYEPLLVKEGEVDLREWMAEELYLALPFAPCHETLCVDKRRYTLC